MLHDTQCLTLKEHGDHAHSPVGKVAWSVLGEPEFNQYDDFFEHFSLKDLA
jgi:hypothetical protein